jgi:hypothetical protein
VSTTGVVERPTEPPRIDPRMRARWVRARRAEGRRRLHLVAGLGVVVVVVAAAVGVAASPLLAVRTVVVSGADHETTAQVTAAAGLGSHPPMVTLDTGATERRIDSMPWVASARVSRHWPASVTVDVTERTAVAVVPLSAAPSAAATLSAVSAGAPTLLVDATGRVLGLAHGTVPGLPVILDTRAPGPAGTWLAGTTSGARRASLATPLDAALLLATELPAELSADVVSLQTTPQGILSGIITVPAEGLARSVDDTGKSAIPSGVQVPVTFGDSSDLPAKIVALQTLMTQVDLSDVTGIDVSDSQRLNLTGNPQPAIVSTTAGG